MFIKKIVSWISENPPEVNFNENIMEESDKSSNENVESIKVVDNWSSTTTGAKTSILAGSLVEQNEIVERYIKDKELNDLFTDGDCVSESIISCDNINDNYRMGKKDEIERNQFAEDKSSPSRNSFVNINSTHDVVIKKDATDLTTKMIPIPNRESHPSFLKRTKSIFTQTKDESDEQCDIITAENSNNLSMFDISQHIKEKPISKLSLAYYTERHGKPEISKSLYGTLYVVGCSKMVPAHLAERMSTKYILHKKIKANGLIEAYSFVTSNVKESLSANCAKHVILYPSNNNDRTVVVAFKEDSSTDLFQIGRYEKHPIDFTVDDINPQDKARHGVSRFACRISVRRDENHEARIYAGAFNSSQAISIIESGLAHDYCGKMDGFTTNGVLILKPNECYASSWREVSVSGYIYPLRSSKMDASKRPRILEESNVLIDGTLIDLCGVTLIWRTPEGLKKAPTEYYLNHLQSTLHKYSPEYSLLYRDSRMLISKVPRAVKKAYVFLSCGHVIGLILSKLPDNCSRGWSCPICRVIGPIKEFTIGPEPGFYFDEEAPSYAAFKPCGHVATQKTAEFWSSVDIPSHRSIICSQCPFCSQTLNFITKFVKLILPII